MAEPAADCGIAIVGAGPLGLASALALQRMGHTPLLLDAGAADAPKHDARVFALSHGSRILLEKLGAWPADVTPITRIHISQQHGGGRTEMHHADYGVPALGYVLRAQALIDGLRQRVHDAGLEVRHGSRVTAITTAGALTRIALEGGASLHTRLAVCCEGSISHDADGIRSFDYSQHALLFRVTPATPHDGLAWEYFTADGPIALLPLEKDYSVVWTLPPARAETMAALPDAALLSAFQHAFGERVHFSALSERARYPLTLRVRRTPVAGRQVWLGNAAQTLHPVAGQGLNLALRDAWELADTLRGAEDPGAAGLLSRYARRRLPDRAGAIAFTDALVRLFSSDNTVLSHLRGAGLTALDALPPLRHFVARRMLFGARAWP